ncbi:sulfatase-like hydrolase/transferase [Moraxella nasovis]|uniref:phosphoethanolamine transferase n=1 Tax=Moraxella nasovis TaxID=2904121 RepID=UPI001F6110E7|nr:sulfatase-like hydrolase/transferase [Moraxella nasovis]UNU73059.1 sulfatase-like hydrolase/transferase [Moraxella nasovis]
MKKVLSTLTTPIFSVQLSIIIIAYIFLLNQLHHWSFSSALHSLWVSLALLILTLSLGIFHRFILKSLLIVHVALGSIAIFAKQNYGTIITEDLMLSALISEQDLTAEMISPLFIFWFILTAVLPSIWIILVNIRSQPLSVLLKQYAFTVFICLSMIAAFFWQQGYHFRSAGHIRDERFTQDLGYFSPVDAEYNLHRAVRASKKIQQTYANAKSLASQYHYQSQVDDLLVVFVLGESTRGDHFAINGYNKPTNPLLSKVPHLISFSHATSCDTLTINSIHCLASPMLKTQGDRNITHASFGEVMAKMGYDTEIYALQTLTGFYRYLHADTLKTKYAIVNEQSTGSKDISLIPYAKKTIENYHQGKKLLILHTLGSHQTYVDRFTNEQAVFTPYCTNPDVAQCQHQELINAYDNSVVAVDQLLGTLIDALSTKKAVLIYVSDHGESLGEHGYYFHGQPVNTAPKEQFNIPFVVWLSDSYRQTPHGRAFHHNLQQALASQTEVSHDHVFHSLLGCAGIWSDDGGIDKTLNLCGDYQ